MLSYFEVRSTRHVRGFFWAVLFLSLALVMTSTAEPKRPPQIAADSAPPVVPWTGAALTLSLNPTVQEISDAPVFDERLVPMGRAPSADENRQLAAALRGHATRAHHDDFSSLAQFLDRHPRSPWRASVLTGLGLEYHHAARYSQALDAWREAWDLGQKATDAPGIFMADRAVCELASLYSRLGRMTELEALLHSVRGRIFLGGGAERINLAREALSMMREQPEVAFRCGLVALQSFARALEPEARLDQAVFASASTKDGFSLPQVAELANRLGLKLRMAFREEDGAFVIPSVIHWKVGHYATLLRQEGNRYLLEDPALGSSVWATRETLEAETSGFFLVPSGELPRGWRNVGSHEGQSVRGKGVTGGIDPDNYTPDDLQGESCPVDDDFGFGMAVARVHLGIVNLQIRDTPVGYKPPVGPPVRFTVRYNQRDYLQPASQISSRFGPKWTHDWFAYIQDTPSVPTANVKYFVGGGGARTFTGFDSARQTFASQQLDQTRLKRTGPNHYEMLFRDGSKKVFETRAGSRVYLTQIVDPAGNAVTLTYDGSLRLASLTDAIGQVTTISYAHPAASGLITRVTDPFGRFATFEYGVFDVPLDHDSNTNTPPVVTPVYTLTNITDVLGLASRFEYLGAPAVDTNMTIRRMITPYGASTFSSVSGPGTVRSLETLHPDGSRERVEYNQTSNLVAFADAPALVPKGLNVFNQWLHGRNTYYWNRNACAQGYGDYSKAKIYHWLHSPNIATTAGILESIKEPLENRVWYNYAGQATPYHTVGTSDQPSLIGRVLDDGSTQLYRYTHNALGHVTSSIDPLGRELTYVYATNDIDLVEVRQTRGANNELLMRATYNHQHRPLTVTDAAGQTTTNTYNARGQLLSTTNPRSETTTFAYDANGYLLTVQGPLAGTNIISTFTYDAFGRARTQTDENGYPLTFDYDVMDRIVRVTHPDGTFSQFNYDRLDLVTLLDSAGRQTSFEYDTMRQETKRTDALGRVTHFQWCSCGSLGSLTDPMGRTTEWQRDVQGRLIRKQYGDGSKITYTYENATSRLQQVIDEKQQVGIYAYNRDNTLKSVAYANATVPTPGVSYTYDPDYERVTSMVDGTGTTTYSYVPITVSPGLGAGKMASINGPLPDDTLTYGYDELGRMVSTAINGVGSFVAFDAAGRLVGRTNALGAFTHGYEGSSSRLVSQLFPNSQSTELSYGNDLQDRALQRVTHRVGATSVSEFIYGREVPAGRITRWSQQAAGLAPDLHAFGYDAANQLISASITNSGALVQASSFVYDQAGNRLIEQVGASNTTATYNALNQVSTGNTPGVARTNVWDAQDRLVAVHAGSQRTELTYDGLSRLASIRQLSGNTEISFRRFVWCGRKICEERNAAGVVTKRFYDHGMKVESGALAGNYFYTRDHLGSIRELIDGNGVVRARYAYDPFGRRTRVEGDMNADFGFAGMFWSSEARLSLTHYRAYDPELGRWLSRDPLNNAELKEGPNLYTYVANDPVNLVDPEGLMSTMKTCLTPVNAAACAAAGITAGKTAQTVAPRVPAMANAVSTCTPRVARVYDTLETQIAALEASYPAVIPRINEWRELRNYLPTWLHEMVVLDAEFYATAELLAARYGWTFSQAWNFLANRVRFNPETW